MSSYLPDNDSSAGSHRANARHAGVSSTAQNPAVVDSGVHADALLDSDTQGTQEPVSTTGVLNLRDTEAEVARRNQVREFAPDISYTFARVLQVVLAVLTPLVLLCAALKVVASHLFLRLEYFRPGFPADQDFTASDRLNNGSYVLDYLFNGADSTYLANVTRNGSPLFSENEVSHMADVKNVFGIASLLALLLVVIVLAALLYLGSKYKGGIRRGLFAGSLLTLLLFIVLGVLALSNWDRFFTGFHEVFFAGGNWQFNSTDSLIRLFPAQFWLDAGILTLALSILLAVVLLVFTWPTTKRREKSARSQELVETLNLQS